MCKCSILYPCCILYFTIYLLKLCLLTLAHFLIAGGLLSFFLPSCGVFITRGDRGLGTFLEMFIREEERGDLGVWAGEVWLDVSEVLNEKIEPFEELFIDGLGELLEVFV